METDKHYVRVGSFVLITIAACIAFSAWLFGSHDQSNYARYRIRFAESVSGLDVGGLVKFRGVNVGKVDTISIDPTDTRLIRVDVDILKTAPIKTDTVASLKLQGITGAVFVELTGSSPQAPDLRLARQDDEGIPEIPAEQSSINAIVNLLPEILQKVSGISDQLGKLFSDQNVSSLSQMLEAGQHISQALEKQTAQLDELLRNSTQVAGDVRSVIENSKGDVQALIKNLSDTSQQLNALIARTNDAAGGQYQELYQALNQIKITARDISALSRSLKENPSQVIIPAQEKGIPAP